MIWTRALLLAFPLIALSLGITLGAIISLVRKPAQSKYRVLWLLLILLMMPIGAILYFIFGSAKLDEIDHNDENWRN
ncbi:MAG: PLDc N-terminal domain-containing protein [Defluviitaleaceae bacterium]|nr:PLDc N-terminal domain-containing protein [Defluviitaleaceae bacterium]